MPFKIAAVASSVLRARSVSSTRSLKVPPIFLAKYQLNKAVRAPPIWRYPVGEGAKRVTIGRRNFQRGLTQSSPAKMLRLNLDAAAYFDPGFNIAVIAFAIGIGAYFAWPHEPSSQIVLGLSGFLFALWCVFRRYDWTATGYVWLLCVLLLGFGRSAWHVSASDGCRKSSVFV